MIQKLRWRFIKLSMGALFLVLLILNVAVHLISYHSVVDNADRTLAVLSTNHGHFPGKSPDVGKQPYDKMSPEAPYETRFFSVMLSEEGIPVEMDIASIAAVDAQLAAEMAQAALQLDRETGFLGNYRYFLQTSTEGTRIIFLDWGRNLEAYWHFLYISILISAAVLVVVYLMIWLLSPKIMQTITESYEKQKRFITDAGHELKTPLTIISADADVLEMEIGENEWLEDIKRQTRQLSTLTSDLVFLARLEENSRNTPFLDFSISDVVEETASSFLAPAKAQHKELLLHIEPMLSCHGVEKDVRQLVNILLDNALKYSSQEAIITLQLAKQGKHLKLSCSNPCQTPLSNQEAQRLFERFYRTDPSRNSETGGTGLGLSIANAIMQAHGGKMQACVRGNELSITAVFLG